MYAPQAVITLRQQQGRRQKKQLVCNAAADKIQIELSLLAWVTKPHIPVHHNSSCTQMDMPSFEIARWD